MTDAITIVERIHQLLGYPTAFLVAPLALLTYQRPSVHRRLGITYVVAMGLLYALGTFLTFARHPLDSETFRRNLSFNLLGSWLLLIGWRSIRLYLRPALPRPAALDWALLAVLASASIALFVTGNGTMRKIAAVGGLLCFIEARDLVRGFASRAALFTRHVRYMLASFFYVLTVVSIVHLTVLPRRVKWLAPVMVGLVVIAATSWALRRGGARGRRVLRAAILGTVIVAWSLAIYVGWAVFTGRLDPFRLSQS